MAVVNKEAKKQLFSSNVKLNEIDAPSPRVITLQNKWRAVWRISVDRKKKLQDTQDHLLEVFIGDLFIYVILNTYFKWECHLRC